MRVIIREDRLGLELSHQEFMELRVSAAGAGWSPAGGEDDGTRTPLWAMLTRAAWERLREDPTAVTAMARFREEGHPAFRLAYLGVIPEGVQLWLAPA